MAIPHSSMNSDYPFESNAFNQPDNHADNTIGSNNPIKIGGIDVTNVINMGMNAMTTIGQDSNVRYGGDGEAFLSDSFGDMDGNGVEDNKE